MKKIFLTFVLLFFATTLHSEETTCGKFNIVCKTNKFIAETKEYQKKKFEEGKEQQLPQTLKKIKK